MHWPQDALHKKWANCCCLQLYCLTPSKRLSAILKLWMLTEEKLRSVKLVKASKIKSKTKHCLLKISDSSGSIPKHPWFKTYCCCCSSLSFSCKRVSQRWQQKRLYGCFLWANVRTAAEAIVIYIRKTKCLCAASTNPEGPAAFGKKATCLNAFS